MKGLARIPQIQDLQLAYEHLQTDSLIEAELVLYAQWTRFDPRLAEICVLWISQDWARLNPMTLRKHLSEQPWPAAFCVLLEFAVHQTSEEFLEGFKLWKKLVCFDWPQANFEQYFVGQRSVGGKLMFEDAQFSYSEYLEWGYLGREILQNKSISHRAKIGMNPSVRKQILISLFENNNRVTTQMYWEALNRCISKRQAERDLIQFKTGKSRGVSRGRYYVSK